MSRNSTSAPASPAGVDRTRTGLARAALLATIAVVALSLGGSLYESLVVNTAWLDHPALIQPERGGIDRKVFWIPIHTILTVGLVGAAWACWPRRSARRWVLAAAALYLGVRLWTALYFIPLALEVEAGAVVTPSLLERSRTWVLLSALRAPLMIGVLLALWRAREALAAQALERGGAMNRAIVAGAALIALAGLPACDDYRVCDAIDEQGIAALPDRLSATGLYEDLVSDAVSAEAFPFRPSFELWSDGAVKRRWIRIPPGTSIDTREMDSWQFPVGTTVWKEFTRDGVRVETRMLGLLDDGWIGAAYLWSDDGSDATIAPDGATDALGTPHDVPASNQCDACHGGRRSHVLGFSAVQLAGAEETSLADLADAGLLSHPPAGSPVVPGDELERGALGYLHANCGHCHNSDRPPRMGERCFDPELDVDFWIPAEPVPAARDTPTYQTAIDRCIEPGHPDDSRLVDLVSDRGDFQQMPPLATEAIDRDAVDLLRSWIEAM